VLGRQPLDSQATSHQQLSPAEFPAGPCESDRAGRSVAAELELEWQHAADPRPAAVAPHNPAKRRFMGFQLALEIGRGADHRWLCCDTQAPSRPFRTDAREIAE